ncbi:MAG: ABC transporter ATP-binding protein [Nitrososphaeria archaeon]
MIKVENLTTGYYKEVPIIKNLSMTAEEGKITVIVGSNGSGKSTLLKTIYGLLKPFSGRIYLGNRDITGEEPYNLTKLGVRFIFQERSVFPHMTVMENLEMGCWILKGKPYLKESLERIFQKYPVLRERSKEKAEKLSGGQQRILEVARSLIVKPKVILMDEPTAQLAPKVAKEFYNEIVRLRDEEGITVLLVDQNVESAINIADYVYVLKDGSIHARGEGTIFKKRLKELVREWLLA